MSEKLQQDHYKVAPVKHSVETDLPANGEAQKPDNYLAGRGAQFNTKNRFLKDEKTREHIEGIDDWTEENVHTQYIEQESKTIVNKVESPDVGMSYSMNPYAGCEHGCIYCYARNVHEYWGYSAGLDFESKIIIKKNAPKLLRKFLMHPKWDATPIMLSGNTDCYQPAEQTYRLTRGLLEVCNEFNQPVGILTKNSWILKDKDVLQEMAKKRIVSAMVSITSFNEDLRRVMEPRTTTAKQKLKVINELSSAGVRMGIMMGPMIPGLNDHEMQRIMKAARDNGATFTAYTFIRLNGAIKFLFHDWLYKNFPDRADKVWHLIETSHDGKVNDTRWGVRMRGEGPIAQMVAQQYKKYGKIYGMNAEEWSLDTSIFKRPGRAGEIVLDLNASQLSYSYIKLPNIYFWQKQLSMALLEVKNISKQLQGGFLVKDISFAQEALQKIAIAGESGAGKTTLLKMISGHAQPDSGTILYDGKRVIGPLDQLLPGHKQIAYLSQHYELRNNYRVEELMGFDNKFEEKNAAELFEICRIHHLLKRRTDQLSGGEKQRISLCMQLIKSPRMLVLDEPFSNLDPIHTDTLKAVLEDITERLQVTCMLTSHDPHDTLSWAGEIIVMKEGQIVQQGTPQHIYHQPVNEYVAGMFGRYNLLTPEQAALFGIEANGKNLMIRPEDLNISATANDSVKGTIQKISFWGGFYEAEVLVGDVNILVRMMKNDWKVGEQVHLTAFKKPSKRDVMEG